MSHFMRSRARLFVYPLLASLIACVPPSAPASPDDDTPPGLTANGSGDGGEVASPTDAGSSPPDSGLSDDSPIDAGPSDAGPICPSMMVLTSGVVSPRSRFD